MGLYIQTHSMHGLFRADNPELGADEDTGGQIVYVLELAKALGKLDAVDRVDIMVRKIVDPQHPGYDVEEERINDKVAIIRIPCGPDGYIKKILLWPYLDEFITNTKAFIKQLGRKPDILHSNYADSGLVCSVLSKELGIPQVHTGHSLGIPKMNKLGVNKNNYATFDEQFHFTERIRAEQATIDNAKAIVASTSEEIERQYSGYEMEGNSQKFSVIAPGLDVNKFHDGKEGVADEEEEKHTYGVLQNVLAQGLKHPERVPIAVLSRLDKRKNLIGLVKAYAADRKFQQMANLVIFAQTLDGDSEAQKVIKQLNKLMRDNNLYENIALPGIQLSYDKQVPAFYRFIAKHKGIFVNPALIEPFGLTILEAMASGVPVVATKHGGPSEIITDGENGFLIDPKDPADIADKIKQVINHPELYKKFATNGEKLVHDKYTWEASARYYLDVFNKVLGAA